MRLFQVVNPEIIGLPADFFDVAAGAGGEDLVIPIDYEQLFNNSSGTAELTAFNGTNQKALGFGGAGSQDRTYFSFFIPDAWQGETIDIFWLIYHRTSGLTGTGSPPDDQTNLQLGYETVADKSAYVNLGLTNDGTAPHEFDTAVQLGTTQEAVHAASMSGGAGIAIGASDRIFHGRYTRLVSHASEGFAANQNLHLLMGFAVKTS